MKNRMDSLGGDIEMPNALSNLTSHKPVPYLPITLIVALLVTLIALGVMQAARSVSATTAAATAVADRFVAAMGAHNYRGASALCAPLAQSHTSAKALQGLEALVEQTQGAYVRAGTPAWSVQNTNGLTSVTLTYPAQYANGIETITLTMIDERNGYRVYEFDYSL